ncbi:MAG: guanylate kinase [Clostridia bacterium]|nr:guanylate kinase [Clostridia bacterium]MBQ8235336.1 guanylate kinase [Clostridia bacterium]MBQ8400258.1 guanylate kinase [Clostridia bacterium]
MSERSEKGLLVIISGPAGSGKGTVVGKILSSYPQEFCLSVSATTRAPRVGEEHGVHYYFIDKESFEERIEEGRMLEYASYCGNYYGTPAEYVEKKLDEGKNVILEIEVQGALKIKEKLPETVLVMITPPDYATLEARLRGRGTNTEEDILNRLQRAKEELELIGHYDYAVINDDGKAEQAAEQICRICESEKRRVRRQPDFVKRFFS